MKDEKFFEQPTDKSLIKAAIVTKYFDVWSKVMLPTIAKSRRPDQKIAYCDLFAGAGQYKDGTPSTPVLIIQHALQNKELCKKLVTIFNDGNPTTICELKTAINSISNIDRLENASIFYNEEVGTRIENLIINKEAIPTLFFIDPFGYKGVSQKLLKLVVSGWGCDSILLFNYNRIRISISNPLEKIIEHINNLFGQARANSLRERLAVLARKEETEDLILSEMIAGLKSNGAKYVVHFCFKFGKDQGPGKTSHYLILATKDSRGSKIMLDIMAHYSSGKSQGIPTYEFRPHIDKQFSFDFNTPLDDLKDLILNNFMGKTISVSEVVKKVLLVFPHRERDIKQV